MTRHNHQLLLRLRPRLASSVRSTFSGRLVLTILICLSGVAGFAGQAFPDSLWVNVSRIRLDKPIIRNCLFASSPDGPVTADSIGRLDFRRFPPRWIHPNVPMYLMNQVCYFKFGLENEGADTELFYFTPGFFCKDLALFQADPRHPEEGYRVLPDSNQSRIYRGAFKLRLEPGEKRLFVAAFRFARTNTNNAYPYLIEHEFLQVWMSGIKHQKDTLNTITYIIAGILLMMIFYSLAVYIQNRNREFLFYSGYALCSAALVFYKSLLIGDNTPFNILFEEYLDFMLLGLGAFFYLVFIRQFLNTRQDHPFLEKLLTAADWILTGLLGVFSILYFFTQEYRTLYFLENYIIKIFLFLIGIVFIAYSIRRKDPLLYYLAGGNAALILFSILSLSAIFGLRLSPSRPASIWNMGMFYYELGLVFELLFFLLGLAYKNRRDLTERVKERERLKLENERKEFEKQVAVLSAKTEERDRISADMHDELGSGVTAIRLMSEIVKAKMKDEPYPELDRISNSANDLLGKMNTIIWTMKSSNDSLESLIAYLREHSLQYFENTPVHCRVRVPDPAPAFEISGEKRRTIFLSVKEALNNVLKHAQASEVYLEMSVVNGKLHILVKDNGVGIDKEKLRRFGNGLSNMKRRMESIQGEFSVESDEGSTLRFVAPL